MKRLFTYAAIIIFTALLSFPTNLSGHNHYTNVFTMISAGMAADDDDVGGNILQKTDRIKIINLGAIVNTPNQDYAPTISADGKTLYFVSNRPGSIIGNKGKNSHDFWVTTKQFRLDSIFETPTNIDYSTESDYFNVNSVENEGAASIAADKQSIFFTASTRDDGLGYNDIYFSTLKGNKWSKPYNLGKNVNSESWDGQPAISPDKSRLYFISTRPGPNSNTVKPKPKNADIWYCDWDDELEEWMPAKNLEAVNTSGQEWTPFIAADGVTLFFASNKIKPNVGGLDFYTTRYDEGTDTWSKPLMMPEPINTKADEAFITLPASGDVLYFSSTRQDIYGKQGKLDVYMAFIPTFFRAVNVVGTVVDECSQEFIPALITIKNATTGRVVVDSVTMSKNEFFITISNADYGPVKDSLKFVDLEITGKNDKYGQTSIIQRVEKPTITDDPGKQGEIVNEIRIKLTLGETPVINAEMEEASYITRVKRSNPNTKIGNFRGLLMEETITWEIYPLLSYLFYDIGKTDIPKRYQRFSNKNQTSRFTDTTIQGGTIDKYYHVLNIYGYRLNQFPDEKLTIIGCTDASSPEEKSKKISQTRAEKVRDYLRDIWNISESRMKVEARLKPKLPSGYSQDPILGKAENRRVELHCKNWEVIKPVFFKGSMIEPQPAEMNLLTKNGIEDKIIAKRRIEIKRGEKIWQTLATDEIGLKDGTYEWDWQDDDMEYPKDEVPFTAQLILTTTTGHECASVPIKIPVMQISSARKRVETAGDSTFERYNLILFPFNSANAGPLNARIMNDYVYSRCKPTSIIKVTGHTDNKGLEKSNLRLSVKRAGTVMSGIKKKTKGAYGALESIGVGEDKTGENKMFDNERPEGRFYNRTVQVIIRTPLTEYDNK